MKKDDEYCKIVSDNKASLKSFMKILCQNCGFNNIYGNKKAQRAEDVCDTSGSKTKPLLNIPNKNNYYEIEAGQFQLKMKPMRISPFSSSKSFFHTYDELQSNSDSIAGILAMSIGKIDLSNPQIDVFLKKKKRCLDQFQNLNTKVHETNIDCYLNLKECKSGLERIIKNGKYTILSDIKNQQSKLKTSISSNSLEQYSEILKSSSLFLMQDVNRKVIFNVNI